MAGPATVLLELQATDIEIMRAEKRLEELPEKRAILEVRSKIRDTDALKVKAELLVRKLSSELKARQDEIATHTLKLEVEQSKVMQTADHRQIQALTREMDGLTRRVDKLEMESLQYMERIEKATAQLDVVNSHSAKLAEQESALIERYRTAGGGVQAQIAASKQRRERLAASLDPSTLSAYEKARDAKGGVGVGSLDGSMCTACHMSLPAERVAELRDGDDVGICPACRRLIVVRAEDTA